MCGEVEPLQIVPIFTLFAGTLSIKIKFLPESLKGVDSLFFFPIRVSTIKISVNDLFCPSTLSSFQIFILPRFNSVIFESTISLIMFSFSHCQFYFKVIMNFFVAYWFLFLKL